MATSGSSFSSQARTGTYASKSGFHAGADCFPRSTTGPSEGTWDSPTPATICAIHLHRIFHVARREEFLVALAAHLRAHAIEAVAGRRADLEHGVDVHAGLDQAFEVAFADQVLFTLGE